MISRKIGFRIRKASTAISVSHSSMLASRRRNLEATPEKWAARTSRELSVTFGTLPGLIFCERELFAKPVPTRTDHALYAEGFAPLLDDLRHALGDFGDRRPDDLQV